MPVGCRWILPKTLREIGDKIRDKMASGIIVLGGEFEGKAALLAMVSKELTARIKAGDLISRVASIVGGKGGGRPDMAQAGGSMPDKLDEAIASVTGTDQRTSFRPLSSSYHSMKHSAENQRIVITGVGLAAPGAANLADFRANLLAGRSGITTIDLRYMGVHPAGICHFAETRYRKKRENSRGTRAGCIGVYCANEALVDAGIDFSSYDRAATGVYIGLTEHGTVETENEVYNIGQYGYDVNYWTHHHNPRTVLE